MSPNDRQVAVVVVYIESRVVTCCVALGRLPSCGDPGDIENGYMRGRNYTVGSSVRYYCNQGFCISGSSVNICGKEWSVVSVTTCINM